MAGSSANCDAQCPHTAITECGSPDADSCCPADCNSITDEDCSVSCDNGVVEAGETCDPISSCPTDCIDGDPCTDDTMTGSPDNCNAACPHTEINLCDESGGDGCCPDACTPFTDIDCPAVCDNGVLEPGETCDDGTATPCPTDCIDGDPCTDDTMNGDPSTCDVECPHTAITSCTMGDPDLCCPAGCTPIDDDDCGLCGNGQLDTGETCDDTSSNLCPTDCFDDDPCTDDTMTGSAATCDAQCPNDPITGCTNDDGCCPAGCVYSNDNDCDCGNGVIDSGETCDDGPDSPTPCPTDCDDEDTCTDDTTIGSPETCDIECTNTPITLCTNADGCCPTGCTRLDDGDYDCPCISKDGYCTADGQCCSNNCNESQNKCVGTP